MNEISYAHLNGRTVIPTNQLCKILGVSVTVDRIKQLGFSPTASPVPKGVGFYWNVSDVKAISMALSGSISANGDLFAKQLNSESS